MRGCGALASNHCKSGRTDPTIRFQRICPTQFVLRPLPWLWFHRIVTRAHELWPRLGNKSAIECRQNCD